MLRCVFDTRLDPFLRFAWGIGKARDLEVTGDTRGVDIEEIYRLGVAMAFVRRHLYNYGPSLFSIQTA
jgi:hypothetical protein